MESLSYCLGKVAQKLIAKLKAVSLIEKFEIRDIEMNKRNILSPALIGAEEHLSPLIEEGHVKKSRKIIRLLIGGEDFCLGEGITILIKVLVLIYIYNIDIE